MGYKEQGILWDLENKFPCDAVDLIAGEVARLLGGNKKVATTVSGAVRSTVTKKDGNLTLEVGFYFTRGDGLSVVLSVTDGTDSRTRVISLSKTGIADLVRVLEEGEPIDTVYNAAELLLEESRETLGLKVASA